jgi:CheY-like chemotaxis protein
MARERLLVCDDEEALGRFVRNVTQPLGYEVCLATSGEELVARYEAFAPTIILLDMVMPDMDGNEVILWLAEHGYAARLIIMTGYHPQYADHARILADFRGIGSVATLRKPFGIDDLLAVLGPRA